MSRAYRSAQLEEGGDEGDEENRTLLKTAARHRGFEGGLVPRKRVRVETGKTPSTECGHEEAPQPPEAQPEAPPEKLEDMASMWSTLAHGRARATHRVVQEVERVQERKLEGGTERRAADEEVQAVQPRKDGATAGGGTGTPAMPPGKAKKGCPNPVLESLGLADLTDSESDEEAPCEATKEEEEQGGEAADEKDGYDPAKERPLLLQVTEAFPEFNMRKVDPARQPPFALSLPDRMRLLWDIRFLSLTLGRKESPATPVVYAGGSPGTHLPVLAALFPMLHFFVYDSRPFAIPDTLERITLSSKRFDKKEAARVHSQFGKDRVLFITAAWEHRHLSDPAADAPGVTLDMDRQREWLQILQPRAAALKFWLPVAMVEDAALKAKSATAPIEYLAGNVWWPIWGPQPLRECMLTCSPPFHRAPYDVVRFARQVVFFERIARPRKYVTFHPNNPHAQYPIRDDGVDWKFDSSAEIDVLLDYLKWKAQGDTFSATPPQQVAASLLRLKGLINNLLTTYVDVPLPEDFRKQSRSRVARKDLSGSDPVEQYLAGLE